MVPVIETCRNKNQLKYFWSVHSRLFLCYEIFFLERAGNASGCWRARSARAAAKREQKKKHLACASVSKRVLVQSLSCEISLICMKMNL